jgi:hypothetical protein
MQLDQFADTLDSMAARTRRRLHGVVGGLAIAGRLLGHHVRGQRQADGYMEYSAEVLQAPCASIRGGAALVRTEAASAACGRTRGDFYAYVPYMRGARQDACVMRIQHLLLVRCKVTGWPNDEARLAVGTLYDRLTIRAGAGLETKYNDDPAHGACCVPRLLHASQAKLAAGYPWVVHVRQIHCPVVTLSLDTGMSWVTIYKMGYHGVVDSEDVSEQVQT